jgi:hypothetical protein
MVVAERCLETLGGNRVHVCRLRRIQRQLLFEVPQDQCAAGKRQLQFSALEHASVLIAENRQQQFVLQLRFHRVPIDIEKHRGR